MKQSRAYKKFLRCHRRSIEMIRRHHTAFIAHHENKDGNIKWHEERERHDDLFRAGIVLCTAAMDAYFTDRFCEALIPYIDLKGLNPSLEKTLKDSGFDTKTAVRMFNNKRPKRVLSNMVRKHRSKLPTQNFEVINKLYKGLGYDKTITHLAQEKSGRKRLLKSIEKLVDRRHKIVHAGDYNQNGKLNDIDYRLLYKKMLEVKKLVESVDAVLDENKI